METPEVAVQEFFSGLGLVPEIGAIYNALYVFGPQTISELARSSKVERTLIYRLLDELRALNLIEIDSEYKHGILRAAPIGNLQILLAKKEQEVATLQANLPLLERALAQSKPAHPATNVQFYRGPDGVKQMLWNETKSKGEILGILHENIQVKTNSRFFERWTDACNARGLHFRGIVSDEFQASQHAWYGGVIRERLANWEPRFVSPALFKISHNTIMYDNVVGHFNWQDDEIYGVEIHNADIANSQRQLFELLWKQARPLPPQ